MAASFTVERASVRQKLIATAGALLVCAIGLAAAPFASTGLAPTPAFLPAVTTAIMVTDLITSFLLISQFRLTGALGFAILGGAFLFTGMMAVAQLVATPHALTVTGILGGELAAAHLWLYWHGGFAAFIVAFSVAELVGGSRPATQSNGELSLELAVLAPIVLVMLALLAADGQRADSVPVTAIASIGTYIGLLNLIALAAVLWSTRGRTVGDLALAVATLASLFDVALSAGAATFSLGWYVGRLFSLVSSCSILIVFLAEVTQIHARTISLNMTLEKIAHQDGLTGLSNRRQFDERLATEWRGAVRRRSSLGLVMIDVDFFKRFNDRYGHMAGDEALRRVALAIGDTAKRTTDLSARYGGEEFSVILPDTELGAATQLAESIRLAVKRLGLRHEDNAPAEVVTVSIGVAAAVPSARSHPESLTQAADQALYRAKHLGRDRVVVVHVSQEMSEPMSEQSGALSFGTGASNN